MLRKITEKAVSLNRGEISLYTVEVPTQWGKSVFFELPNKERAIWVAQQLDLLGYSFEEVIDALEHLRAPESVLRLFKYIDAEENNC